LANEVHNASSTPNPNLLGDEIRHSAYGGREKLHQHIGCHPIPA